MKAGIHAIEPITPMILWKLRVKMAELHIGNKELAEASGVSPTTISRLKHTDELRQISGDVLSRLCFALNCSPGDLLVYIPDESKGSESQETAK